MIGVRGVPGRCVMGAAGLGSMEVRGEKRGGGGDGGEGGRGGGVDGVGRGEASSEVRVGMEEGDWSG